MLETYEKQILTEPENRNQKFFQFVNEEDIITVEKKQKLFCYIKISRKLM